jgi:hypothetical protein
MSTFKISPTTTLRIADLKDQSKEALAESYDGGRKGYLTTNEAYQLYADNNGGAQPTSIDQVETFLGGIQHPMTVQHLGYEEAMALPFHLHDWRGDFHVDGFGAGNVMVGGYYNWERPTDPKAAAFLFNMNLTDMAKLEHNLISATLVVGPSGFTPEKGSALPEEAVEIPMTLATLDGHMRWDRTGSGWQPEQKFLAAAVDIDDMRALGNGSGVSCYVRLETTDGVKFINRDGVSGQNFDISDDDLKKYAGV